MGNMKWKMMILMILLVSSFSPSSSQEQNDKGCQDSYSCTRNENCQFYQEQISELTRSKVIETKNKILTTLRGLVCNKKARKVCCPVTSSDNPLVNETTEVEDVPVKYPEIVSISSSIVDDNFVAVEGI